MDNDKRGLKEKNKSTSAYTFRLYGTNFSVLETSMFLSWYNNKRLFQWLNPGDFRIINNTADIYWMLIMCWAL